jgi:hypothetical protein
MGSRTEVDMSRIPLLVAFASLLALGACSGDDGIVGPGEGGGPVGPGGGGGGGHRTGGVDARLATPETTVRTFCGAARAMDQVTMALCIHERAGDRELILVRTQSLDQQQLYYGSQKLALGRIGGTDYNGDRTQAAVQVTFASGGGETFELGRTPAGWKILDW